MKSREAQELGQSIARLLQVDQSGQAFELLAPILAERTPFSMLRRIGGEIGQTSMGCIDPFLSQIAAAQTEGGWPVISGALAVQLHQDLGGTLVRCRSFIREADVWYAADTLGEWVVGQALVEIFKPTLDLLRPWREDGDVWVRRSVGTSIHYWAKRSRGADKLTQQARTLLSFLEPMFEEQEISAVKGIGWGLKTLGRYYPLLLSSWLAEQVVQRQRPYRALMLRKATTYLSETQKHQVVGNTNP